MASLLHGEVIIWRLPLIPQKSTLRSSEELAGCTEWERLFHLFVSAISEIMTIQAEKSGATLVPAVDLLRFEQLLRLAEGRKSSAKKALISHLEAHPHCGLEVGRN